MLIVQQRIPPQSAFDAELALPFELRQKTRLRTTVVGGEEIGLFLERGTVLRDGEFLQADDGRVVRVAAAAEDLLEVRCADPQTLARAAYHLGNRHVAVQVAGDSLRLQPDHVLRQMLVGLGLVVGDIEAPFEPEAGAYSHGHQHDTMHGKGKIHTYGRTGG